MALYFELFGVTIPGYGFMIVLGIVLANILAMLVMKRTGCDFNDFIILESYCFLGGFIGAKVLFLLLIYKEIDWTRITNFDYLNELMLSGFVFYGGLILGFLFVFVGGKIHKIDTVQYIRNFIFLIPLIHCFGRIGCFMAGCCYGIPYEGFGAVIFPEESYAIAGVSLFPIQLVEAGCLFVIALCILYFRIKWNCFYTVELYFIVYAVLRFILEFLRFDEARGQYGLFSTSQWISIVLFLVAMLSVLFFRRKSDFDTSRCSTL